MTEMARWDARDYDDIVSASYDPARDALHVGFANGESAEVPAAEVVLPRYKADWTQLKVEERGLHLTVPVEAGMGELGGDSIDVPGFYIRSLTDPAFAAHLQRSAEQAARQIGERIRLLRRTRGLTAKEVARRAGIAAQTMTRIEHGRHDAGIGTLDKILAAMGYSLHDLVPRDEPVEV